MNEEIAIKICEQMKDDIDNLCDCCRKDEKNRTCIGCRELAIETILKENARLKDKLKDIEKILDADCCVENIYQAMCQYLNIHDFELNLEDYLKEN